MQTKPACAASEIAVTLMTACSSVPEPSAKVDQAPSGPTKVLQFYASPGIVTRGEAVTMCYGVENATSVTIEPKVRDLTPSTNRCFSLTPEKSTVYTLLAKGNQGEDSAQLGIQVQAAPPPQAKAAEPPPASDPGSPLNLLMASTPEVAKGQPVTICYGVTEVAAVRVDPPVHELMPRSSCFTTRPDKTTTYTVIAVDNQKKEYRRQVTVTVK